MKTARERHQLRKNQLALMIGVSPSAITHWESGVRPIPDPVEKLMSFLFQGKRPPRKKAVEK